MTMNATIREAIENSISNLRRDRANDSTLYARLFPTLADLIYSVRCERDEAREQIAAQSAPEIVEVRDAAAIRSEMKGAALAAGWERGATDKQIDLIVSLATKANDFGLIVSGGHFTKRDASDVIDAFNR